MKHLFIINPVARGIAGNLPEIRQEIESCFVHYPWLSYDIHVTRWQRDAVGFIKNYCMNAPDLVRVYAVGGNSMLYEVINGAIGLPNIQVAAYPKNNEGDLTFIRSLGENAFTMFDSVGDLVFSETQQMDLIRCNDSYALSFSLLGMEAMASMSGKEVFSNYRIIPKDLCYFYAAINTTLFNGAGQDYNILLDDIIPLKGAFMSAMIANQPYYGRSFHPGVDARPDDGMLDLYILKPVPRIKIMQVIRDYVRGNYHKWPEYIQHHCFRKMKVQSNALIALSLDGEFSYQTEIEYEILPGALDFVCPKGIEMGGFGSEQDTESVFDAQFDIQKEQETAATVTDAITGVTGEHARTGEA